MGAECTIATLIKAMARIAVIRENNDLVAPTLQPNRRIHDQALRTADAQVRVEEDDGVVLSLGWLRVASVGGGDGFGRATLWGGFARHG